MTGILQGVIASIGGAAAPGQEAFTTAGTFSWVAPAGVTKVSVVAVGGANTPGSNPGALAYKNNITVVPGNSYSVVVANAGQSYFINTGTVSAGTLSCRTGDGGGDGGNGPYGGGAGGYSGKGGSYPGPQAGAGGGGGSGSVYCCGDFFASGGGGGVGLLGQGANGAAGAPATPNSGKGGGGGSGGTNGSDGTYTVKGPGGFYGGGPSLASCAGWSTGGTGAVRIIWPGCARSFPSTRTANE